MLISVSEITEVVQESVHLYDLATINSFSVYKMLGHEHMNLVNFQVDLAMSTINHFLRQQEPYST